MQTTVYPFPSAACTVYHDAPLLALKEVLPGPAIVITDQHLMDAHGDRLRQWPCIVIPPGEQHKTQATADHIIERLIAAGADRQTTLIGVGGGVVTDITGYVASVYMRGIPVGFVPTSILAMVDAALGGKNGVDVGLYKNMVGTFRQPGFLWYDMSLLQTLPEAEWVNGFAEVIKHACIKDAALFDWLEQHHWQDCRADAALCAELVRRNSNIKAAVVVNDEREQGERKLLNFGHTIGHAVENLYRLPHGHAISIGMVAACQLSEELNGFASAQKERLVQLLQRYGLPTHWVFDKQKVMDILLKDKKKINQTIHFILLQAIGQSQVVPIGTTQLADLFEQVL